MGEDQPRGSRPRLHAALATMCIAMASLPGPAAEPAATPQKKPDWAGLDSLLWAGDYEKAAAAADEIATLMKPKRRDADYVAESIGFFRALLRRGFAEFRLGRLDAAAATLDQARRIPRDVEFRRLLAIETRGANAKIAALLMSLDINLVELLDLQMLIPVERLRLANLERAAGGARSNEPEAALRAQVGEWLDDLDKLAKTAEAARESLADRLEKAGGAMLASPYNRALVGRFRSALIAGSRALELSRLPFGDPRSDPSEPPEGNAEKGNDENKKEVASPDWLAEARSHFKEAATALDEAIAAAVPKGAAALKPEQTIEILLMREELGVREGELLLAAGDPTGGRERFSQAADLVKQIATLRKLKQPGSHPDLFVPLVRTAEAMLQEARRDSDDGDPKRSRNALVEALKLLAQAEGLPFPNKHPLRITLLDLQSRLEEGLSQVAERIPGFEAADAAARRLRRSLYGAAVSSDVVSP